MLQTISKAIRPLHTLSRSLVLLCLALAVVGACLGGCSECNSNDEDCHDVGYYW